MNGSEETGDTVIQGTVASCERLLAVAGRLSPEHYCARWNNHNGIGPHMRHCYEHLAALVAGYAEGVICYDARERSLTLEEDPTAFMAALAPVVAWITSLNPENLNTPLTVCQIPKIDAPEIQSASTLRRELLFLTSHTIHHLALVSMLAEVQGVALPDEVGVAYSTTTHAHQQRDGAVTTTAANA